MNRSLLVAALPLLLFACGDDDAAVVRKSNKGGAAGATSGSGRGGSTSSAGRGGASSTAGQGGATAQPGGGAGNAASAGNTASAGAAGGPLAGGSGGAAQTTCPEVVALEQKPAPRTAKVVACTLPDELGQPSEDGTTDHLALGKAADGTLQLYTPPSIFSDAQRRFTVSTTGGGCTLSLDTTYAPPTDVICEGYAGDPSGGVWCWGHPPTGGLAMRRVAPTPTPLCLDDSPFPPSSLAYDPTSRVLLTQWGVTFQLTDTSCTPLPPLPSCTKNVADVAADGAGRFYRKGFEGDITVLDTAGKALSAFDPGFATSPSTQKSQSLTMLSLSACTSGICGWAWSSDAGFYFHGLDGKGELQVISDEVPLPASSLGDPTYVAIQGAYGIVLRGTEDSTVPLHPTYRYDVWLVSGL